MDDEQKSQQQPAPSLPPPPPIGFRSSSPAFGAPRLPASPPRQAPPVAAAAQIDSTTTTITPDPAQALRDTPRQRRTSVGTIVAAVIIFGVMGAGRYASDRLVDSGPAGGSDPGLHAADRRDSR